jgi:AcrR family transcriptional regulator
VTSSGFAGPAVTARAAAGLAETAVLKTRQDSSRSRARRGGAGERSEPNPSVSAIACPGAYSENSVPRAWPELRPSPLLTIRGLPLAGGESRALIGLDYAASDARKNHGRGCAAGMAVGAGFGSAAHSWGGFAAGETGIGRRFVPRWASALQERFDVARPQAPDFEQRQKAIVDQAAELFATRGFLGTSIADLAVACGASKSLIYHYYPAKEEILYAVMASHIEPLVEDVREIMGTSGEASAMLRALVHRFMARYVGAAPRQRVLVNELVNLPEAKRAAIIEKQRVIVDSIQELLTRLDPRLRRSRGRARVKAMLILGMMNWTHIWFDPKGAVSADAVADMVADLVIRGSDLREGRPEA